MIETLSLNYNDRPDPHIRCIVLHYTDIEDFSEALDLLTKDSGKPVSSHYALSKEGIVHKLVDESKRAWHAGVSRYKGCDNVNDFSIGIEIDNPGFEFFKKNGFWAPYPKVQIEALIELLKDLLKRYPHLSVSDIVGHDYVAPRRKIDPGPHFPWTTLWDRLA